MVSDGQPLVVGRNMGKNDKGGSIRYMNVHRAAQIAWEMRRGANRRTIIRVPAAHICPPDGWQGSDWSSTSGFRWVIFLMDGRRAIDCQIFEENGKRYTFDWAG